MSSKAWLPENDRHYMPLAADEIEDLVDGDLTLRLREITQARPADRWAGSYAFDMVESSTGQKAGSFDLRLADTEDLLYCSGHIGYGVDEPFRGRRYSARAVRLILPVAKRTGMSELWITCDPDNIASRRTIDLAGGEFVEIVDIPETSPKFKQGFRQCCRYLFVL